MVDFVLVITLAPVHMDLVDLCVKIEPVQYIVKMGEFVQCQKTNVNVETDFMAHDAIKGNGINIYAFIFSTKLTNKSLCH